VDGQATFLGDERRDVVNDAFRELTLPRNPNLWHSLPAAKQYEIENSQTWRDLEEKMANLKIDSDMDTKQQREEETKLRKQKAKLMKRELRKWQRRQPYKPGDPQGYHREIFSRCSFMMPARRRLADGMFEVAGLRSPAGLQVIHDMMELYEQEREVEFRPGLEPDRCCCNSTDNPATDDCSEKKRDLQEKTSDTYDTYDWKHIYKCFKTTQERDHGFAELCFLCSEWFIDMELWEIHCQGHVNNLEDFPVFLDPLVFNSVLAIPGFCYDYLRNPKLPASIRKYQFKNKPKWQSHIQRHIDALPEQPGKCELRTQQCSVPFNSALELQFHLQDAHGIHTLKRPKSRKRRSNQTDEEYSIPPKKKQPTRQSEEEVKCEIAKQQTRLLKYACINTTIESVETATTSKSTSKSTSCGSSLASTPAASSYGCRSSRTQTPLSSICDEVQVDVDISSHKKLHADDDDFVMMDALDDDSIHQSNHISSSYWQGLSPNTHPTAGSC
jgi:hypothetical protein